MIHTAAKHLNTHASTLSAGPEKPHWKSAPVPLWGSKAPITVLNTDAMIGLTQDLTPPFPFVVPSLSTWDQFAKNLLRDCSAGLSITTGLFLPECSTHDQCLNH